MLGLSEIRIETERLILRPLRFSDARRVTEQIADVDILRLLARAPWPYRLEDAEQWLDTLPRLDPDRNQPLAIEHRDHGLIGGTGFHTEEGERLPELGYWLARAHWGQGLATEAAVAALSWARDHWGKRGVVSAHFVDNPASARVLVKAGFLYTGVVAPRMSRARGEAVATRMMVWLA
jgi:RimJ/RimL family protein N-acetyltransferase